jgi:hypothetical protein
VTKTQSETLNFESSEIKEKIKDLHDSLNAIKIAQFFLHTHLDTDQDDKVHKHLEIINANVDRARSTIYEILGSTDDFEL